MQKAIKNLDKQNLNTIKLMIDILKQQLRQHQFQILNKANKAINKKLKHQIHKIYTELYLVAYIF